MPDGLLIQDNKPMFVIPAKFEGALYMIEFLKKIMLIVMTKLHLPAI